MFRVNCRWFWTVALLSATVFLVSCATSTEAGKCPRFHEAASADVILRHYRWDHVNLIQPEYREDGFLIQLSPATLGTAFERFRVRRNLAVVVMGWAFEGDALTQLVADWKSVLREQGFQRVVCLRAGSNNSIDGLLIIDDTKRSDDTPKQTAGL